MIQPARSKSLATATLWLCCAGSALAQAAPLVAQTVSGHVVLNGRTVEVEVLVGARQGADPQTVNSLAAAEVRKQGGQITDGFTPTEGLYPQFFDKKRSNNAVTVFYNPGMAPIAGTTEVVRSALAAWSSVKGSTFRYTFGGTTTRTPTNGDGFNDVGFVPATGNCDSGCVLATTFMVVDNFKSSAIQEFDIRIYNYPNVWTLDPTTVDGIDLPTTVLHELGHAAGIGHSQDPAAVMYPYLGWDEMRRNLTVDETTALAFLYPFKPSSLVSTSSPSDKHNFNLLAALYTPAPGGGTYVDHLELGPNGVNKNGDAVFAADVDAPVESLFLASKGAATQRLLAPGQSVSGLVLGDHTMSFSAINDVGDVAVVWTTYPGDYREPLGIDSAVLRKPANGAFQAVVVPRVTPVPGGGRFYGAYQPAIGLSQAGDVAFLGLIDSPFGDIRPGVFVAQANGSIVTIARPGDPAPGGGAFRAALWVSMASQGGYVSFVSGTMTRGAAVFVNDPSTGQIIRVAGVGDPDIGGGMIYRVARPQVNAKGDVLFGALTFRPGQRFSQWELFLYSKGTLKALVRNGDVLPDGRIFLSAIGNSWSLNDAGDVVYDALAKSSQTFFDVIVRPNLTGYYATWKSAPEFILRDLDTILGAEAYLLTTQSSATGAHGDVVFSAVGLFGYGTEYLIRASRKVYTQ